MSAIKNRRRGCTFRSEWTNASTLYHSCVEVLLGGLLFSGPPSREMLPFRLDRPKEAGAARRLQPDAPVAPRAACWPRQGL